MLCELGGEGANFAEEWFFGIYVDCMYIDKAYFGKN